MTPVFDGKMIPKLSLFIAKDNLDTTHSKCRQQLLLFNLTRPLTPGQEQQHAGQARLTISDLL